MSNIINENRGQFDIIPTYLIQDNSMSDRARFVYCYMASKPESWSFIHGPMAKELNISTGTLKKYIKELVNRGWLVQGKQANANGRFGAMTYTLKSSPTHNLPLAKKADTQKNRCVKNIQQDNIEYKDNIDSIDNTDKTLSQECDFELKKEFDFFRKAYPGTRRGIDIEFENFKKKNKKDWREIIPKLMPALEKQKKYRESAAAAHIFVPEWKHLRTWINQKCWTEEPPVVQGAANSNSVNQLWDDN